MQKLYDLLFRLIKPVLHRHLASRVARGKELAERVDERFGIASRARPEGKLIWLHGASNGESLSLLPLVERLLAMPSSPAILVTTGTVSSASLMEKRLPGEVIHQFLPLDHPAWTTRFLRHWRPDGVLWVESELWPGILSKISAFKIPAALLNAKLSDNSVSRWLRFPGWAKKIADTFSFVAAQSSEDAERWRRIGGTVVPQLLGNLKFIATPLPCDAEALVRLRHELKERPVWIMASAHPGEELVALSVHESVKNQHPDLLTIIVPRHTQNGEMFAKTFQAGEFKTALRSRHDPVTEDTQIYIADTMGELGLFYRIAKLSVVGGSFVPIGGHNPIEPALLGSLPLYGPYMFKQRSICDAFERDGASKPVSSVSELASTLQALLANPADLQRLCSAAQSVCVKESESGQKIWDALAAWRHAAGIS